MEWKPDLAAQLSVVSEASAFRPTETVEFERSTSAVVLDAVDGLAVRWER
jgi:hypothetical protein